MKPLYLRIWQWLTWRVDCSWCQRTVWQRPLAPFFKPTISHGICPACVARQLEAAGITNH